MSVTVTEHPALRKRLRCFEIDGIDWATGESVNFSFEPYNRKWGVEPRMVHVAYSGGTTDDLPPSAPVVRIGSKEINGVNFPEIRLKIPAQGEGSDCSGTKVFVTVKHPPSGADL